MKENIENKMWCRYYHIKGKKYYDFDTLSYTLRGSKDALQFEIKHMSEDVQSHIMKQATFEKVSVTIKSLT